MKKVYSHENLAIVESAKGLLELNNIDCLLKNEYYASGGHVGFTTIPIELWVRNPAQAAQAITLLEEIGNEPTQSDWTCTKCGEINAGSFETCWKCQTNRS